MKMPKYTIYEAKTHFSKLLKQAENGEEVIIMNRNRPIAQVIPIKERKINLGFMKGQLWMSDDFDEPIDELFESDEEV